MASRLIRSLCVALALVCAAQVGTAYAQGNPDSIQRERDKALEEQKRRELAEIERQAREKRDAAGRLKGEERSAVTKLRRTEQSLNATRRRLRQLGSRQKQLDRQMQDTQVNLERAEIALDQQRAKLARRIRNIYKQGAARELEFLISTNSIAQLLARWDFLVMVAEQDRMLLGEVRERKDDVEAAKLKLEINKTEVGRTATRTERETKRLSGLQEERSQTVQRIKTQREAYEAAAAELEKTARDLKRLLSDLERRRTERGVPYTGDFAKGQGSLEWPVRGPLVGRFGTEKHPKWGTSTMNNGVDIQAAMGTPVRAVAKGRIDYTSDDFGAYGQIVIVNHGDGYYTLYGHLSEIGVNVGQEIESGSAIGRVGDTGSLKGVVLHFEVRKGGTALNPEDWLR